LQIKPDRCVQAHTVLKTLPHKYANAPVLVLGGKNDSVRQVAERLNFSHTYIQQGKVTDLHLQLWFQTSIHYS
jgi:ribonucleotide monophosphatase NagD (HAD superfamily)